MKNENEDVAAPAGAADEPDDFQQSVDQYMTSLIQRLHDSRSADPAGAESKQPPAGGAVIRPMPLKKAADPAVRLGVPPTLAPKLAVDSASPRPVRLPDKASDIVAMRELAIEHARQNLQTHARGRYDSGATAKLLVGLLAIVASFSLLTFWGLEEPLPLAAAATSIMVAVRWSWQFLMLTSTR